MLHCNLRGKPGEKSGPSDQIFKKSAGVREQVSKTWHFKPVATADRAIVLASLDQDKTKVVSYKRPVTLADTFSPTRAPGSSPTSTFPPSSTSPPPAPGSSARACRLSPAAGGA